VSSRFTRTAESAKEVWNTLAKVGETVKSVNFGAVEACNEGSLIRNLSPGTFHCLSNSLAVGIGERALHVDPLAFVPHTALYLAALGHLQAVQRVTVTTEQTSDKVILAAQLATLEIEFLPPILVVAMLQPQVVFVRCATFTRAGALSEC
jgi:hypothetical protein